MQRAKGKNKVFEGVSAINCQRKQVPATRLMTSGHVVALSSDFDDDDPSDPLGVIGPSCLFIPLATIETLSNWVKSEHRVCGPFRLTNPVDMEILAMVMYIFDDKLPVR